MTCRALRGLAGSGRRPQAGCAYPLAFRWRSSRMQSGGGTRNLQEEGGRDDDITIPQKAFARSGLEPSAHFPARRENGRPSVGCRCARAPGTERRAAHAAGPAALRAALLVNPYDPDSFAAAVGQARGYKFANTVRHFRGGVRRSTVMHLSSRKPGLTHGLVSPVVRIQIMDLTGMGAMVLKLVF